MVWQRDLGKERRHLARWRRSRLTVREYCAAVLGHGLVCACGLAVICHS